MNFEKFMKNQEVLTMLHDVLEQDSTKEKVSVFSPNGEKYGYNQYSLLIVMDSIMKYAIVIDDLSLFAPYLKELQKICKSYANHKELVLWCNELLGEMIRVKLGLYEKKSKESKRAILSFLYDRYIVHGYLFHSFPSTFKNKVEETGIDPKNYKYPVNEMKQTYYIFKNHKYTDILPVDFKESAPYISITDSPAMAYFYAFSSPMYFCNLTATGKYMKDDHQYDREAYYRKDENACYQNMKLLCEYVRMSEKEEKSVLNAFSKQWKLLDSSHSYPCIAFIDRSEVGKNKLNDIDTILKRSEEEDLVIGISRITDSRYSSIKRYTPLLSLSFIVKTVPSYSAIKENRKQEENVQMEVIVTEKEQKETEKKEEKKRRFELSPGYASVISLMGLFLISLGLTLIIIFRYYGIGGF